MTVSLGVPIACSDTAGDLGVIGRLYPISEPDLLAVIQQRLQQLPLQTLLQQGYSAARARAATPPGIRLPVVQQAATRAATLIPTALPHGRDSTRQLLFIDGTDARQLRLAERQLREAAGRIKLVLVAGAPLALRSRGIPAWFDQQGALTRRLGIQRVPALVYMRDGRLYIDEQPVHDHD